MRSLLAIALLSLLLFSCAKERPTDVGTHSIWTHYLLSFDQEDSVTTATVITRFNDDFGSRIQLHDEAEISFNGEPLVWNSIDDEYVLEIDSFVADGQFTYVDVDANVYTNVLEILPASFPAGIDTISRFTSLDLEWVGPPIGEEDNILLDMYSLENSTVVQFFENAETATQVHMNVDRLLQFPNGHSEWHMRRRGTSLEVNAPLAGGLIEWTYKAEDIIVYLE